MSEILSGARYTLGGLLVMTLWSVVMMSAVQWKLDPSTDIPTVEEASADAALLRFGPGSSASDATRARYHDMRRAAGLE